MEPELRVFRNAFIVVLSSLILLLVLSCGGGSGSSGLSHTPPAVNPGGGNTGGNLPIVDVTPPAVADTPGDVAGVIKDAMGVAVPDAEVAVDTEPISGMTDATGTFLMKGVAAGTHTVTFAKSGHTFFSASLDVNSTTPLNVGLTSSDARTASADNPGYARMYGKVLVKGTDEGIPGAHVIVYDNKGFFRVTESGDGGYYVLEHLPAGSFYVLGYKRGFKSFFGNVELAPGDNKLYYIPLERTNTGNVEGVVKSTGGDVIAHAAVFLLSYDGNDYGAKFQMFTNEQGAYRFGDVPAGTADMIAAHPDFNPGTATVEVISGQTIRQDFTLEPKSPPPAATILEGKVVDPHENALAGVAVRLTGFDKVWEATTDENGAFRFELPKPGVYYIRAAKDGYKVVEQRLEIHEGGNQVTIVLQPLDQNAYGNISGTVTYKGTDGASHPAVQAHLTLLVQNSDQKLAETWTNAEGHYYFEHVLVGVYLLGCAYGTFAPLSANVEVTANHTTIQDFFFDGGSQQGYGSIAVIVFNQNQQKVAGAHVKVFAGNAAGDLVVEGDTNADGYIVFEQINAPGVYVIQAYAWDRSSNVVTIELHVGERKYVTLTIERPSQPGFASLWAIVSDHNGNPIAEALVKVFKGGPQGTLQASGYTDATGKIHFVELPAPESYAVKAFKGDLYSDFATVSLAPGDDKEVHLTITLPPPPTNGAIFGHVWNAEQQPILEAHLELFVILDGGTLGAKIAEAWTNADGYYAMDGIPAGHYKLAASHPDYQPQYAAFILAAGQHLEKNFTLTANPPANGWIFGHVINGATQAKLPGVIVTLYSGSTKVGETTTGDLGGYEFGNLAPGFYGLHFEKAGFVPISMYEVQVFAGQGTEKNAVMYPSDPQPAKMYGHVYNTEGVGIVGALVHLGHYDGNTFVVDYYTTSGQQGYYLIDGIAPGGYIVKVVAETYQPFWGEQAFVAGDSIFRNFTLNHVP